MSEMTYEELEAWAEQMRRERDQALADLQQAREAIGGVRAALRADRDRWQKIALFNIEVQGYDDPADHIRRCYRADGTYHGGSE